MTDDPLADTTLIFVDAETYYDDIFNLKRMSSLEYITNPRFKLHMLAVDETHGQQPARIIHPDDLPVLIDEWRTRQAAGEHIAIGAHNVLFDGLILSHHYGFEADFYVDTRSMSKGLWHHESASLAALAERLWPDDPSLRKGHELASSLGVESLPPDLFGSLAGYCQQDTRLCALAYHAMLDTHGFPPSELHTIDIVARMTVLPRLRLDTPLLERYTAHLDTQRREAISKSGLHLFAYSYNLDTKGRPQFVKDFDREQRKGLIDLEDKDYYLALKVLGSNTAFCAWLRAHGIPIPMKASPSDAGRQIPALGQADIDYQRMTARNPRHKNIWEARKVAKSNINLTRARRFIDIAERFHGRMPMPLTYSAAHTHRFGGAEQVNPQNMTRSAPATHPDGELRPGALRRALLAPDDYSYIYVADSSNIEARMLAYVSDNNQLLDVFADGGDPYIWMAQRIYNKPLSKKEHPMERAVGKATLLGCFGAETRVLTDRGIKKIVSVQLHDRVWDGTAYVPHEGLIPQGEKPVIDLAGVLVTPDHLILIDENAKEQNWITAEAVHCRPLHLWWALSHANNCWPRYGIPPPHVRLRMPTSLRSTAPVFDLLNCGPRNRFTIITNDGPLIVHNCGYGMGVDRFRDYLNTGPLGMPPIFFKDETMYQHIISTYRRENFPVCDLWQRANQWLYDMSQPDTDYQYKMLRIQHQRVVLPSGLALQYPNLRYDATLGWMYDSKEEGNATRIFGASLIENCMQALTAEFIKYHMHRIDTYFKQHLGSVVLQVHDEIIAVGPEADADDHMTAMLTLMRGVPDWAPGLPVDAEGGYARNYSK